MDNQNIIRAMNKHCHQIIGSIQNYSKASLREYATSLWKSSSLSQSETSNNARLHVYRVLEKYLYRQLSPMMAKDAIKEFKNQNLMQTGPHCQLMLYKTNFLTTIFSLMAMSNNNCRYYFTINCSTVRMLKNNREGPGIIILNNNPYNVFGISKTKLRGINVCSLNSPVEFSFKNKAPKNGDNIEELINLLVYRKYNSAVDAFHDANQILWKKWHKENRFYPVFLSEMFLRDLAISHLLDPSSFLFKLFEDQMSCKEILCKLEKANLEQNANLPIQTDFFWRIYKNKITPLKYENGYLIENNGYIMKIDPNSILESLLNKDIVPNVFLFMVLVSIVPNIKVLGGILQCNYYNEFQNILNEYISCSDRKCNKLSKYLNTTFNNSWGDGVIKESMDVSSIINDNHPDTLLSGLIKKYENISFSECVDNLNSFKASKAWQGRIANLAS